MHSPLLPAPGLTFPPTFALYLLRLTLCCLPTFHLQISTPSSRPLSGSTMSGQRGAAMLSSCWWATRQTWPTRGRCEGVRCRVLVGAARPPLPATPPGERVLGYGSGESVLPTCPHASEKGPLGTLEALRGSGRPVPMRLSSEAAASMVCRGTAPREDCMEPCAPGPAQRLRVCGSPVATVQLHTAVPRALALCLSPRNARASEQAEFPVCRCSSGAQTRPTRVPPATIRPLTSGDPAWSDKATGPGLLVF